MAEPSKLPVWATDSEAKIVEPADVKKQAGWVQEIPPAEWFNWWMNNVYKWILHFKETLISIASGISTNAGNIDTLETDVGNLETAVDTLETAVGTVSYGNFDAVFPDAQFDTAQTVNIKYKKEILSNATVVTLFLPKLSEVAAAASFIFLAGGYPIPAAIRPSITRYVPMVVLDGSEKSGAVIIGLNGAFGFRLLEASGDHFIYNNDSFTPNTVKGFPATVIQYTI